MKQKMMGILAALKNEYKMDSEDIKNNTFILNTHLEKMFGFHTYLLFDIRGNEEQPDPEDFLTIEIRHWVGWLDNLDPKLLLYLLRCNRETFRNCCSYIAIQFNEDGPNITLNSYHYFKYAWPDKEIADIINRVVFDLPSSFMYKDPNAPQGINFFREKCEE